MIGECDCFFHGSMLRHLKGKPDLTRAVQCKESQHLKTDLGSLP